jgi:hypothetical protein
MAFNDYFKSGISNAGRVIHMWDYVPRVIFYLVEMCFYIIGVDQGCSCRKYLVVMAFIVVQGLTVNKQFLSGLNVSPEDYYTSALFLQIVDSTRRTINTSNIVRQHDIEIAGNNCLNAICGARSR